VHDGRLYVPTQDAGAEGFPILDAATGALAGRFLGARPIGVDGLDVIPADDALLGVDPRTAATRWRVAGALTSVIAVGHDVYGFRDGRVRAYAAEDGLFLWAGRPAGSATTAGEPLLAAGPDTLLTFWGGRVTAWRSGLRPAPGAIAVFARPTEVPSGRTLRFVGVLGRDLRGSGVRVRVDTAEWPRGRFRRFETIRVARDGGFVTVVTLYRNARLRVASPGRGSSVVTVYAEPRVNLGTPHGRRLSAGVVAPRTRLAGRTLVIYQQPRGSSLLLRAGVGRLRETRRGRARTVLRLERRVGRRELLGVCIRGGLKLRLGRPSPFTRRCGAPRIAL
jgi:hypothetical protein